ncbi:paramecium surface antigen repeat-containing protein [Cavenderia fasciculata]|uniref:Paramecium surface antigen repeat-containing protein n=1 Tax=Cavenderia fasciculata TaxID=261658 RepID=F4QC45_CACFS|nr:paramecium surface antigen repeat-containing protein [Cavenderia fasciculata]EGG13532.1 paramecium surface antigen repeat-containing protein [Cavenderia fasciculata]|eukprot:XP_004350236.1 paramecium surface antigen repeat-containing protein [Cavenderia fasciculata]
MKQIIILAIFFLAAFYAVQGEQCDLYYEEYACGGFNTTCGLNVTSGQQLLCQTGYYCQFANKDDKLGLCQESIDLGGKCTDDDQCLGSYDCENGVCAETQFAQLGEECASTADCYSKLICSTATKTCTNSSTTCHDDYDCQFDENCGKDNQCFAPIAVGQVCDKDDECGTYSLCEKLANGTKVCAAPYSLAENAICSDNGNPNKITSCDANKGLVCLKDVCSLVNTNTLTPTPSDVKCNSTATTTCQDFEDCICTSAGDQGKCYQTSATPTQSLQCAKANSKFIQCLITNKCQNIVKPSSCLYNHCASEYCDMKDGCALPQAINQVENCQDIAQNICAVTGSSSTIAIPMFTVVALVLSVFFF